VAFRIYLGPMRLPAAPLVLVEKEIGEQHGKPTGTTREMPEEMRLLIRNAAARLHMRKSCGN
jgi:hypothetical protein